jgi:hypothetical protein
MLLQLYRDYRAAWLVNFVPTGDIGSHRQMKEAAK